MLPVRQLLYLTPHIQLSAQIGLLFLHPPVIIAQAPLQEGMQPQQKLPRHPFHQRHPEHIDVRLGGLSPLQIQHPGKHAYQLRTAFLCGGRLILRLGQYLQLQPAGSTQDTNKALPL